jgi:hypothetical protein
MSPAASSAAFDSFHQIATVRIELRDSDPETALTYQFAGQSASGLPPDGEWRCLFLAQLHAAQLRDGDWHSRPHTEPQTCVDIVDVEPDR